MKSRRKQKGFTLLELLISVAVLGLIAALAIPNLTRARLNTNENLTIGMLKTVSTAMESYRTGQSTPTFPSQLVDLTTPNPPFLEILMSGANTFTKSGYNFSLGQSSTYDYTVLASPDTEAVSGNRYFCIDAGAEVFEANSAFSALTQECTVA